MKKDKTKKITASQQESVRVRIIRTHLREAGKHTLQKGAETLFNFDQEIPVKKRIQVNELLMRLHVSGLNCENKLK